MATHLTLTGDRQHGKTEMALRYAFSEADAGLAVLYQCESRPMVREALHRAERIARYRPGIQKVFLAPRNEHIRFTTGGAIRFVTSIAGFGMIDVHILDGVDDIVHPEATRVLRTAVR